MSDLVLKNYKVIISVILLLVVIPTIPVLTEIIFKFGNIVGTYIRLFGSSNVCF